MEYKEAIDFLKGLTKFGFNLGLGRIKQLLSLLDNPHKKIKFVHVGGTNGKGSTSAMITNILKHAGYKVGLFTSPHIHCYRERFKINDNMISEEKIASILTKLRPLLERMVKEGYEHPTEFEVSTAIAIQYFFEEQVDIAVLEVGLGGAIDSTNVINPLVSIITNVEKDHMNYLGNTIEEIASVKAGIIKTNTPIITGEKKRVALEVIEKEAGKKNAPLLKLTDSNIRWNINKVSVEGSIFGYVGENAYKGLMVPLLGEHQVKNAVLALATIEELCRAGFKIPERAIRRGLATTKWPLRMEIIKNNNPTVILDVAHNVDGIISLKKTITKLFKYNKFILLISLLEDKEREKIIQIIAPIADTIIVTRPKNSRAGDWEKIGDFSKRYCSKVLIEPEIDDAVEKALQIAGFKDLVCITGSFYMVSDARLKLMNICTNQGFSGKITTSF